MSGTLTGKFMQIDGVTPAKGQVHIEANVPVIVDAAGNTVYSGLLRVPLVDGAFSVSLPASDDLTLNPSGFTFNVSPALNHAQVAPTAGVFVLQGQSIDLSDAVQPDPAAPTYDELVDEAAVHAAEAGAQADAATLSAGLAADERTLAQAWASEAAGSALSASDSANEAEASAAAAAAKVVEVNAAGAAQVAEVNEAGVYQITEINDAGDTHRAAMQAKAAEAAASADNANLNAQAALGSAQDAAASAVEAHDAILANSLKAGTVTTGAAGTNVQVSITGTAPDQTLNLTIPKGDPGGWVNASSLADGVDLNTLTTPGTYRRGTSVGTTTALNYPMTSWAGWIEVIGSSSSNLIQRATSIYTSAGTSAAERNVWVRSLVAGTWAPWMRVDVAAHEAATDPHTQYARKSVNNTFTTIQTIDNGVALRFDNTASGPAGANRWELHHTNSTAHLQVYSRNNDSTNAVLAAEFKRDGTAAMIGGMWHYRGTGSPEGVVAAGVGSRYVDTAATGGIVEWSKTVGTGTTGWRANDLSSHVAATNPHAQYVRGDTDAPSVITNLCSNPGFEVNPSSGWANNNAIYTVAADTSVFRSGTRSFKSTLGTANGGSAIMSGYAIGMSTNAKTPATTGTFYSFGAYVRPGQTGYRSRVQFYWYDSSNALLFVQNGADVDLPVGAWTRVTATVQAPANAATFWVNMDVRTHANNGVAASGHFVNLDDAMLVTGSSLPPHFDGTSKGARWTGTAHASTSERLLLSTEDATDFIRGGTRPPVIEKNLMLRPKATSLADWQGVNATLTALPSGGGIRYVPDGAGSWSLAQIVMNYERILTDGATTLTVDIDARSNLTTFNIQVACFDVNGVGLGNVSQAISTPLTPGVWTRARVVLPLKAGTVSLGSFQVVGTINPADYWEFKNINLRAGDVPSSAYFDGDSPGCRWTGRPDQSASEKLLPNTDDLTKNVAGHVAAADPHTQYARKSVVNTFTQPQMFSTSNGNYVFVQSPSGTVNQRSWLHQIDSAGSLWMIPADDNWVSNGTRIQFDRDGGIRQGNVRDVTGTGSPEGVYTAIVGSRYRDTAVTNGAIQWIKVSGTGNTGWKVVSGDTGARIITLNTGWSPVAGSAFGPYLRREGNLVTFTWYASVDATIPSSIYTFPTGFRPAKRALHPYSNLNGVTRYADINSTGTTEMLGGLTAASHFATWSWITADAWPATLPGTPG